MTSQSTVICASPRTGRSHTARSDRPMSRWISWVRPDSLPFTASRSVRSVVEPGSIEYSAVTQPRPEVGQHEPPGAGRPGPLPGLAGREVDVAGAPGPGAALEAGLRQDEVGAGAEGLHRPAGAGVGRVDEPFAVGRDLHGHGGRR